MVWFYTDDGFYSHPKVLEIPRDQRAVACGVWNLCGSWCADKLTDGRITHGMALEIGCSQDGIDALLKVKLWRRIKGGRYEFVNWSEWQPTREDVEKKRTSERERKSRSRHGSAPDTNDSAGVSARIPTGVRPPRPVPSRPKETDLTDQSSDTLRAPSTSEDRPVDKSVETVDAEVSSILGVSLAPLGALVLIDYYREKAPPNVHSMPAYLRTCLRNEDPFVLRKMIDEKGLAS